ncbi:Predicted small secreted protein [Halopseudomonas litoralis]|uniref:Predicted small secreted protein n=1 Tax=Halopseudomonas litoralis TaxID=797277 RepID=A0A1H1WMV0_9GAMM|nr:entericidin A/B family lipoprotein [Halopseudomonas litoralis]SDS98384.1 Predicted small secreted protein [Halopseudomonas litoralis]
MSLTLKSVLLGMMVLFMAGCNTVGGAGKDIQRGGEAIEDAADR